MVSTIEPEALARDISQDIPMFTIHILGTTCYNWYSQQNPILLSASHDRCFNTTSFPPPQYYQYLHVLFIQDR